MIDDIIYCRINDYSNDYIIADVLLDQEKMTIDKRRRT
jgi:hypothetical protein